MDPTQGESRKSGSGLSLEFAFTQRKIDTLSPPKSDRSEYRDSKVPGLTVRVTPTGKKAFYYRRWHDGAMQRVRLGDFPKMTVDTARTLATEVQNKLYAGIDVVAERRVRRSCPTLGEAFDYYMESYAKVRKRTWRSDEEQFNRYIDTPLKNRKLNTIRKSDIAQLHTKIGIKTPYAANRLRSLLTKVFSVAIETELFSGPNPVTSVKPFKEKTRDRFLDAEELKRFFTALENEPHEVIRDFLHLSLLVGARKSNLLSMAWEDVDRQRAIWRIPETKSGEPQVVPLSQAAMEVVELRWAARRNQWVFPSTGNRPSRSGHLMSPQKQWEDILKRADLEGVRLHDLRRTLASWQAMLGTSELVIAKTLGHAAGSKATAVYARLQNDSVRQSVEAATSAMMKTIDVEGPGDE